MLYLIQLYLLCPTRTYEQTYRVLNRLIDRPGESHNDINGGPSRSSFP